MRFMGGDVENAGVPMKASDLFDLKDRVALVTGASSGLGIQFAKALADNGAAVALVARRVDRLLDLQQSIEAAGGRAIAIEADVTDPQAIKHAFDTAENAFGTVPILVNNAGVAQSSTRAIEVPPEEWRRVLAVDLDAVFYWAQEAARRMLAAGKHGSIVNIASVLGLGVSKGTAAYAVAKAAVIQTTKQGLLFTPAKSEIKFPVLEHLGDAADPVVAVSGIDVIDHEPIADQLVPNGILQQHDVGRVLIAMSDTRGWSLQMAQTRAKTRDDVSKPPPMDAVDYQVQVQEIDRTWKYFLLSEVFS